jgi:hypothetical protein
MQGSWPDVFRHHRNGMAETQSPVGFQTNRHARVTRVVGSSWEMAPHAAFGMLYMYICFA